MKTPPYLEKHSFSRVGRTPLGPHFFYAFSAILGAIFDHLWHVLGHIGLYLRSLSAYDTPKMVRHLRPSWAHAAMRNLAHFGYVLEQLGLSLAEPYNKRRFFNVGASAVRNVTVSLRHITVDY